MFFPLGNPKKASVNFFYHHCKGKVFTNIFLCRKCVSNVFGLSSVAYSMDTTRFSSLCQTRFLPGNDITMTSQVGAIYFKMCRQALRIQ